MQFPKRPDENDLWINIGVAQPSFDRIEGALELFPWLKRSVTRRREIERLSKKLRESILSDTVAEGFNHDVDEFFSYAPNITVLIQSQILLAQLITRLSCTKPGARDANARVHKDLEGTAENLIDRFTGWTNINTNLDDKNRHRDVVLWWALTEAASKDEDHVTRCVLDALKGHEVGLLFIMNPTLSAARQGSVNVLSMLMGALYPVANADIRTQVIHFTETRLSMEILALPESDGRVRGHIRFLKALALARVLDIGAREPRGYGDAVVRLIRPPVMAFLGHRTARVLDTAPAEELVLERSEVLYSIFDAGSLSRMIVDQAGAALDTETRERARRMIEEMEQSGGQRPQRSQ